MSKPLQKHVNADKCNEVIKLSATILSRYLVVLDVKELKLQITISKYRQKSNFVNSSQ